MNFIELLLLAVGLSMDAFAVAICVGLTMAKVRVKKAMIVGLYFGIFQAGMPLIGYYAATMFADMIIDYSQWIAFGLLSFLGGKMILESFKDKQAEETEYSLHPGKMLPLAIATSIDALAVGASFALLQTRILPAVSFIGVTTFVISAVGVLIGTLFGAKLKTKALFAGGTILILIGVKILLEHLGVINF